MEGAICLALQKKAGPKEPAFFHRNGEMNRKKQGIKHRRNAADKNRKESLYSVFLCLHGAVPNGERQGLYFGKVQAANFGALQLRCYLRLGLANCK